MKYVVLTLTVIAVLLFSQAFSNATANSSSTSLASSATTKNPRLNQGNHAGNLSEFIKSNSDLMKIIFSWPVFAFFLFVLLYFPIKNLINSIAIGIKNLRKLGDMEFHPHHSQNTSQFKENSIKLGKKPEVYGNPDEFQLICKASNSRFTKSTKALNLPNGCLVQVSTRELVEGGTISVAEALSFVPDVRVNIKHNEGDEVVVVYEKI